MKGGGVPRFGAVPLVMVAMLFASGSLTTATGPPSVTQMVLAVGIVLALAVLAYRIWINGFAKAATDRRPFFATNDFLTLPGTRRNRWRNAAIFAVLCALSALALARALFGTAEIDPDSVSGPSTASDAGRDDAELNDAQRRLLADFQDDPPPDAIAPAEFLSLVQSHPYMCVNPKGPDSCQMTTVFQLDDDQRIEATTSFLIPVEGEVSTVTIVETLTELESGWCADAHVDRGAIDISGDDARVALVEPVLMAALQVREGVADQVCTLLTSPEYVAESEAYASTLYESLDMELYARNPVPIRLSAEQCPWACTLALP